MAEEHQHLCELKGFDKLPELGPSASDGAEEGAVESVRDVARLNALAQKSLKSYTFVESFHHKGVVPGNDIARVYLTARLNHARIRVKVGEDMTLVAACNNDKARALPPHR